jgi:hypothetical protein
MSTVSHEQAGVMKQLAVVGTIFLPLSHHLRRPAGLLQAEGVGVTAVWERSQRSCGPVLAAADVQMADGLAGADVTAALGRLRVDVAREIPAITRLYLTPV